jgi:hypothetical protein
MTHIGGSCPGCGDELTRPDIKFCTNCGIAIFSDEVLAFLAQYCEIEEIEDTSFFICRPKDDLKEEWQKLFYVMPGKLFIYIDVPFALKSDVEDLDAETGPWGIGSFGKAHTYHNVMLRSSFNSDIEGAFALISNMNNDAVKSEKRLNGES